MAVAIPKPPPVDEEYPSPTLWVVWETKFLAAFTNWVRNFQEEVRLVVKGAPQNCISLYETNSAHTCAVRGELFLKGSTCYGWSQEDKRIPPRFSVGVNLSNWKVAFDAAGQSSHVRLSLWCERAPTATQRGHPNHICLEFGPWFEAHKGISPVVTSITVPLINIRGDAFEEQENIPWQKFTMDSIRLRKQIVCISKLKPETVQIRLRGEIRNINAEDKVDPRLSAFAPSASVATKKRKTSTELFGPLPKDEKTQTFVPKEMLWAADQDKGMDMETTFHVFPRPLDAAKKAKTAPEAVPLWQQGVMIDEGNVTGGNVDQENPTAPAPTAQEQQPSTILNAVTNNVLRWTTGIQHARYPRTKDPATKQPGMLLCYRYKLLYMQNISSAVVLSPEVTISLLENGYMEMEYILSKNAGRLGALVGAHIMDSDC
jgi:hypothetical protein